MLTSKAWTVERAHGDYAEALSDCTHRNRWKELAAEDGAQAANKWGADLVAVIQSPRSAT